jgi:hypothetical protein
VDLPIGNEGNLNGATAVTVLVAPATSKQRVIPRNGAGAFNADTVAHNFTWQKNKAAVITVLYVASTVAAGAVTLLDRAVTLDATDETLEVKIEGAHTTTAPTFDVSAIECS